MSPGPKEDSNLNLLVYQAEVDRLVDIKRERYHRVRNEFILYVLFFIAFLAGAILLLTQIIRHNHSENIPKRPPIAPYFQAKSTDDNGVNVESGSVKTVWPDPPPHEEVAKVARYIVHISDWASIATISAAPHTSGYPFANILSLSDGPINNASGVPYMYLTPMDLTSHDLKNNSKASLSMTEAQSDYCYKNNYDPESPLCARVLLTGTIVKVESGSDEETFGKDALFSRHPEMKEWPAGHQWFVAKMDISHIYVLDFFGGASEVDVEDYYSSNPF